jgi:hypothetical protein
VDRHPVRRVRGDDDVLDVVQHPQVDVTAPRHGAGVKGRDLVVVEIRGDETGGSGDVIAAQHRRRVDPAATEGGSVLGEVVADGGAEQRPLAEQGQGVGDVRGRPAPPLLQLVDQEGDVDQVRLVGKDVVAEPARENHDGVEGDRTGHRNAAHGRKDTGCRPPRAHG